jgi:hypothetical protein
MALSRLLFIIRPSSWMRWMRPRFDRCRPAGRIHRTDAPAYQKPDTVTAFDRKGFMLGSRQALVEPQRVAAAAAAADMIRPAPSRILRNLVRLRAAGKRAEGQYAKNCPHLPPLHETMAMLPPSAVSRVLARQGALPPFLFSSAVNTPRAAFPVSLEDRGKHGGPLSRKRGSVTAIACAARGCSVEIEP